MPEVIHGYWECHRCKRKGRLETDAQGRWDIFEGNRRFVNEHMEQCFTDDEREAGIGPEQFFVGKLTRR
jgi:hypothetical protein